jgi:PhnB protein
LIFKLSVSLLVFIFQFIKPNLKYTTMDSATFIPEGYQSVMPYLIIKNAAKALDFYIKVFNAKEVGRLTSPDGKIGHAELQIGSSRIMLADEFPEWGNKSPETLGGSPVSLCIFVPNVDEVFRKAI